MPTLPEIEIGKVYGPADHDQYYRKVLDIFTGRDGDKRVVYRFGSTTQCDISSNDIDVPNFRKWCKLDKPRPVKRLIKASELPQEPFTVRLAHHTDVAFVETDGNVRSIYRQSQSISSWNHDGWKWFHTPSGTWREFEVTE